MKYQKDHPYQMDELDTAFVFTLKKFGSDHSLSINSHREREELLENDVTPHSYPTRQSYSPNFEGSHERIAAFD